MLKKTYKKIIAGLCICTMIAELATFQVSDAAAAPYPDDVQTDVEESYVEDEILVVLNPAVKDRAAAVLSGNDYTESIQIEESDDTVDYAVVELTDEMSVSEAVDYFEAMPEVLYAQPNYIYEIEDDTANSYQPSDTFYSNQWYLNAIHVPQTWNLLKGRTQYEVLVAVIDTGIDLTHPDLYSNIDTAHTVSCVTTDYNPISNDFTGHGTHIAGEIAAVFDNQTGIAGISNNYAKIAAIQCSDGKKITTAYAINGVNYAILIGARIINMSLGTASEDLLLKEALQKAYDADILIVCSAGNDGTDATHYPSAYDTTIGVIASDKEGNKRSGASYGTDNFISAPGERNYSTIPTGSYGYKSGSSMSAGVVSGAAALLISVDPTLTPENIKQLLASTATDTYQEGFDAYSGYGIVNAEAAVRKMLDITDEEPDYVKNLNSIESFVKRLYYYTLEREADEAGLADWTGRLSSKAENGGQVAAGFLFSDEFQNRQLSDTQYVDILYKVFLGREADDAGRQYWIDKLENGMSRLLVMNGFSGSEEFSAICQRCGFASGQVVSAQWRDKNEGTTAFVARLYKNVLDRNYDVDGLNDWCKRLLTHTASAKEVATNGFFHSAEFANRNVTDEQFVKLLYRTFLNREYDQNGYEDWLNQLKKGASRDKVIRGFADSAEFYELMAKYGV